MNSSPSQNSDGFTASPATLSGNGSKGLDSEPNLVSQQSKPSTNGMSHSGQADNLGRTTTFGTPRRRLPYSTACAIHGPFTIQTNGSIGQTVIDADGIAIAWTTDVIVAQVICEMMNEFMKG